MRRFGGNFAHLLDALVRERTGLDVSNRKSDADSRLVGRAMERAGATDETMYLALLQRDHKVFDDLIADLTIPETYFFRDPPHYEMLRREVLPALLRVRQPNDVLEVWSAGCASGEEPYSLAMLLEQELLGGRSQVLGSDVSVRALARARRGTYSKWSLRATTDVQVKRYFEPLGREFQLAERIRSKPRFIQHSLSSPSYPTPASRAAGFDLILCRNVLIYFDAQAIIEVGQKFARSLADDGWLLMGPSDPALELEEWCDRVATPCGLLYHRRGAERQAVTQARKWKPQRHGQALAPAPVMRAPSKRPPPLSQPPGSAPAPEADPLQEVRALIREHGLQVAEAGCRDLLERHSLQAPLHLMHATLLYDLGRDDDAEIALRRVLYLDRSLLVAQMLSATLAEQRGDVVNARRIYTSLAREARALPEAEPVPLGDGLTNGALASLASQRVRALQAGSRPDER